MSGRDATASILEVADLNAGYGAASVLHDISLRVDRGETVVVLGANGAGKTTLLRAIAGVIAHSGVVRIEGKPGGPSRPDARLRRGVALIPQGRGTLTAMTVMDNLRVGATTRTSKKDIESDIERTFDMFPALSKRSTQTAGTLSGGEQQMLAIARALMARPRLLMCDEVSLGLAPVIVQGLFAILRDINREDGTSLLLVEQNAELALDIASRVYLLEVGSVVQDGPAEEFRKNDAIRRAYLGY